MRHISNIEAAWIAFAGLIPVILYLLFSAYQTRQRMAVRRAVIDKFASAEDFAVFLQSPAGQKFVTELSGSDSPARAVIGAIQKAILLIILGAGVWWIGATIESATEVASLGILLMVIGGGILISAAVSYHLSKSWGLLTPPTNDAQLKTTGR